MVFYFNVLRYDSAFKLYNFNVNRKTRIIKALFLILMINKNLFELRIMKIAALLYLVIYNGVLNGYRSFLLHKNTGVNPLKNIQKEGIGGFIDKVSAVCFVSVSVIVLNFVFLKSNYLWLIPVYYLENLTIGYIGIGLSIIGLAIDFIAQLQMVHSWRLKINEKEKTKLVCKGFFKYSRNPIYVGFLISNLGTKIFNLKFGQTILVTPQKDENSRFKKIKLPVLSTAEIDEEITQLCGR